MIANTWKDIEMYEVYWLPIESGLFDKWNTADDIVSHGLILTWYD